MGTGPRKDLFVFGVILPESCGIRYDGPIDETATYEGHDTRARFDDFRMCEYEWQREASDHDECGDEAAEVDGARAFGVVGGELLATAVREECVGKGGDYEGQRDEEGQPV